ncbi:hypothetical protein C4J81_17800 [Deltaproteobacteria bacterium Smac51]|nr:hypothetical protein C4J81_17800 [Deltaproteobacteria bacterium Smac51]
MLNDNQLTTLKTLGFLYWRLGYFDRVERLFKALLAVRPDDAESLKLLAAAQLEQARFADALASLDKLGHKPRPSGEAVIWLMRAKALWGLGREAEAGAAVDEYLNMAPAVEAGGK